MNDDAFPPETPATPGETHAAPHELLSKIVRNHVCHFYNDRQDLVDILIPYFKEGLEAGECCLWGADDPFPAEDAMAELRKVVPNLKDYIDRGQLLVIPSGDFYVHNLDAQKTYDRFLTLVKGAVEAGFQGVRTNGNTCGVPSRDWLNLMIYESYIDAGIRPFALTVTCSYPLSDCSEEEIAGVRKVHQSALVKRGMSWEFIPGPSRD